MVTTHLWPDYDSAYRPTLTRFFTVLLGSVEPVPCFTREKMSRAINIPIFTSLPLAVGGWRCLSCQLGRWGECLHRGVVATEKGRVVSLTVLPNPCSNSAKQKYKKGGWRRQMKCRHIWIENDLKIYFWSCCLVALLFRACEFQMIYNVYATFNHTNMIISCKAFNYLSLQSPLLFEPLWRRN